MSVVDSEFRPASLFATGSDLQRLFADRGARPAIIERGTTYSYADLLALANQSRAEIGSQHRKLVVVEASNTVETVARFVACWIDRHAILTAQPTTARQLADQYAAAVHCEAGTVRHLRSQPNPLHPDLALLLSTSGSTGSPKLVRLSRSNVASNARAISDYLPIRESDTAALVLPLTYSYGLSVLTSHLLVGASVWFPEKSVIDEEFWSEFTDLGAASMAGVPYTFEQLDAAAFAERSLPSLRYLTQAGGRMAPADISRYAQLGQRRGWDFYAMYGQTEATARMAYLPPATALTHPQAIGRAIPGGSFTLRNPDEAGVGELVYRGDNVMMGYARTPQDLSLGPQLTELATGDLARKCSTNLYEVVGRSGRFAKLFGIRIDLDHLERSLSSESRRVFAIDRGDQICLFTTDSEPQRVIADATELSTLPPRVFEVRHLAEVPRLPSHKVDYATFHQLAVSKPNPTPAQLREGGGRVEELRLTFARILNIDPDAVTPDHTFVSLRGDSLSFVAIASAVTDVVGTLPTDWHRMPIRDLATTGTQNSQAGWRKHLQPLDTAIALRAFAVIAVVAAHIGVFYIRGGAHLLLAVAGFAFAKFQIDHTRRQTTDETKRRIRSLTRLLVPTTIWLGALILVTDDYQPQVLFINSWVSTSGDDPEWRYWFVEALSVIIIASIALLAIPPLARWERRYPAQFAATIFIACVTACVFFVPDARPHSLFAPLAVAWAFAGGWLLAQCQSRTQQMAALSAMLGFAVYYFPDWGRSVTFAAGAIVLCFASVIYLPKVLGPVLSCVAASSLMIYLTHYQVYPFLADKPALALVVSIGAGCFAWSVYQSCERIMTRRVPQYVRRLPRLPSWTGGGYTRNRSAAQQLARY